MPSKFILIHQLMIIPRCSSNVPSVFPPYSLHNPSVFPPYSLHIPPVFPPYSLSIPSVFPPHSFYVFTFYCSISHHISLHPLHYFPRHSRYVRVNIAKHSVYRICESVTHYSPVALSSTHSCRLCLYLYRWIIFRTVQSYLKNLCMYARMCVRTYVCMDVCMCIRMYVCIWVCVCVCMYVHVYICVYVCMYVRMHACMYLCVLIAQFMILCKCLQSHRWLITWQETL